MPKKKTIVPSPYTGLSPGEIWPKIRNNYNDRTQQIIDMKLAGSDNAQIVDATGAKPNVVGAVVKGMFTTMARLGKGEVMVGIGRNSKRDIPLPAPVAPLPSQAAALPEPPADLDSLIWQALRPHYEAVNQRIMDLALKGNSMNDIAWGVKLPLRSVVARYGSVKKSIKRVLGGGDLYGVHLEVGEVKTLPPLTKDGFQKALEKVSVKTPAYEVVKPAGADIGDAGAWSGPDTDDKPGVLTDGGPGSEPVTTPLLGSGGNDRGPKPVKLNMGLVIAESKPEQTGGFLALEDDFKVPDTLVQEAFADITEFHRQILLMHYNDNLSVRVIASKLGLGDITVTSALTKGRDSLAEIVKSLPAYQDARTAAKIERDLAKATTPTSFRTERDLDAMLTQGVYSPTEVNQFVLDVLWTMGGKKIGKLMTSVEQVFNLAKQRHPEIRRGQVEAALGNLRIRSLIECRDALDGVYTLTDRTAKAVLNKNGIPGIELPPVEEKGTPVPEEQQELVLAPLNTVAIAAPGNSLEAYIENQLAMLTAASETVTLRSRCQTLETELIKARESGMELDQDDFHALSAVNDLLASLVDIAKDPMTGGMLKVMLKKEISVSDLETMQVVLVGIHSKGKPKA